jgi:hypothetical protein
MATFRVVWEMDIDEVESEREAAEKARAYQRNPRSGAGEFRVTRMVPATEKFAGWDPKRDRLVLVGQTATVDLDEGLS